MSQRESYTVYPRNPVDEMDLTLISGPLRPPPYHPGLPRKGRIYTRAPARWEEKNSSDKNYRARKKLKLKKDQRRVEALTAGRRVGEAGLLTRRRLKPDTEYLRGLERILTSLNTIAAAHRD